MTTPRGQLTVHILTQDPRLLVAGAMVLSGWVLGCDCSRTATCRASTQISSSGSAGDGGAAGGGGTGGDGCPIDPEDGPVSADCGIWASASLGDDSNPGTQEAPVKSLAKALELAEAAEPRRVYACGEIFAEKVNASGVSLYGGFDCQNGWRYRGRELYTTIQGPVALATLTLLKSEYFAEIRDIDVTAPDAEEPGASSIAVFAHAGSRARFRRVSLFAGTGADGIDGEDGSHNGTAAQKGPGGLDGTDACTMDIGLGAPTVFTACDDGSESSGGQGGDGDMSAATAGLSGTIAPNPNPNEYGQGGKAQDPIAGTFCTPGIGGAHGQDGENGFGAFSRGVLTPTGFVGASGGDGTPGLPGQGGGGGGASLGFMCPGPLFGGAGGGSGGAGGCGGRHGTGGLPGGSSVGIAFLSDDMHFERSFIATSKGGRGGRGGTGQAGGQGGLPGYGGLGSGNGVPNGCGGGLGGRGGNGGHGGGGRGGHSAGALHPSTIILGVDTHVVVTNADEAEGGPGGDPGLHPLFGADGLAGQDVSL